MIDSKFRRLKSKRQQCMFLRTRPRREKNKKQKISNTICAMKSFVFLGAQFEQIVDVVFVLSEIPIPLQSIYYYSFFVRNCTFLIDRM